MFVVGAKEAEAGQVTIRSRTNKSIEGTYSLDEAIEKVEALIHSRALPGS